MRVRTRVPLGAIAVYPRMGHGFPRRQVPITAQEVLYSPRRVLGSPGMGRVRVIPTGQTVLWQPRLETSLYLMRSG